MTEIRIMTRLLPLLRALICLFLTFGILGCPSTSPTRFFVLHPLVDIRVTSPDGERGPHICVGPVEIPEYLNQPEIVTRVSTSEIKVHDFAEWAEPLEDSISHTIAENLSASLCTRTVDVFPCEGQSLLGYQVEIRVIQMDGTLGETASLKVSWSIFDGGDQKRPVVLSKRSNYEEALNRKGYEAFVSAQSRLLASLSCDIAEAVCRMEETQKK